MEWIKTSERLPEISVKVLFYDDGDIQCGERIKSSAKNPIFCDYTGEKYRSITHWMPLPPQPPTPEP